MMLHHDQPIRQHERQRSSKPPAETCWHSCSEGRSPVILTSGGIWSSPVRSQPPSQVRDGLGTDGHKRREPIGWSSAQPVLPDGGLGAGEALSRDRQQRAGEIQPGGAKNSSAMLSGSRKDSPEPYGASTMPPLTTPSSCNRASHSASSDRLGQANAT